MTESTTQLQLYNKALKHLGERKLASLTEARECRRYLDDEYPDTLLLCLRSGYWNWATDTIEVEADELATPDFGYQAAFPKPMDWIRTELVSTSETLDPPLRNYRDQNGFWLANADKLYVRYVSGTLADNLTNWPVDYAEYVGVALARAIVTRLTQNDALSDRIEAREKTYWKRAQANDAMDQPPSPWPLGTWTTSRLRRGMLSAYSNSIKNW